MSKTKLIEYKPIDDIGGHHMVFRYAIHGGVTRNYFRHGQMLNQMQANALLLLQIIPSNNSNFFKISQTPGIEIL